jgi:hypothetical protein
MTELEPNERSEQTELGSNEQTEKSKGKKTAPLYLLPKKLKEARNELEELANFAVMWNEKDIGELTFNSMEKAENIQNPKWWSMSVLVTGVDIQAEVENDNVLPLLGVLCRIVGITSSTYPKALLMTIQSIKYIKK